MSEFVRADSRNLPHIDMLMVLDFFHSSDKHNVAEVRGVKTLMASRSGYVETAVGYVEIRRENTKCVVKAKVVPEHKVSKKYYVVTVSLDEKENSITDTTCDGCPASAGGCKHSIVVLYWLEKKATEPSSTSVQCYWAKPRLASEGTQPLLVKDIAPSKGRQLELGPRDPQKLQIFLQECKKRNLNNALILSISPDQDNGLSKFCIFDLILDFIGKSSDHSYEKFKSMTSSFLTKNVVDDIEQATKKQAESKLWHSVRQGRITASKVYEVCHCNTQDGSLVEQILGGYKVYDTKAMKRGKLLEKPVMREIEKKLTSKIEDSGFKLINLICGASPDGVGSDFIVEIKCPISKQTMKNYVDNNKIKEKFYAQCQLQLLATGYSKCAFCIADPEFENNKKITIMWVDFDAVYANNLIAKSEIFWKNNIFPKFLKNTKS